MTSTLAVKTYPLGEHSCKENAQVWLQQNTLPNHQKNRFLQKLFQVTALKKETIPPTPQKETQQTTEQESLLSSGSFIHF